MGETAPMTHQERIPIGEAIRRARLEHGWSQNELAWRTHVSQSEISRYEKGLGKPSWDRYLAFCEAFGWELPYLSSASGDDLPWFGQTPDDLRVRELETAS